MMTGRSLGERAGVRHCGAVSAACPCLSLRFGPRRQVRRNGEATTAMANIPQKSKDATEEALSAIQEALNVRAPETGASPEADKEATSPSVPPTPELFPQDASQTWPLGESTPRRAANDARAGIGQILQTLRHR